MSDGITPDRVQEAFLASPPLIAQQILDLTVKHPNWLRDVYEMEEFPRGAGTVIEQLVFRGQMPQIERGFDKWKKIANLSGCSPCEGPDPAYNWSYMGGHAFERKRTELMERDFRSPSYNVNEIQTTAHFKEVFAKIVENLYRQIDFFKEMSIAQNVLTGLAKKYVVDSNGAQFNRANIYSYRNVGAVRLSMLNIQMLEFFYEQMRRMPDAIPYDVVDGSPIFSLMASHQVLGRLYRDDANLRQDVRFSGFANDLLTKYNFMSTIRGMFIAAPILYPRRFVLAAGTGEPMEVLPFVNEVPGEVGVYSYLNPDYEAATHEEVLIHGRYPFKLFYMPTETSLGENTSFGPEVAFMNNWLWVNPLTTSDPARRVGYFYTGAKIGVSAQFSEAIFGILVERPKSATMSMYTPDPVCPPVIPTCNNAVPATSCPCPLVSSILPNPMSPGHYFFVFSSSIAGVAHYPVQLKYDSGTHITGVLEAISADGKMADIYFAAGLPDGACEAIESIYCDITAQCSSLVERAYDTRGNQTNAVSLVLQNAIKAQTAAQKIVAYFGDCTTAVLDIVSVNAEDLTWVVRYSAGYGPTDGLGNAPLSADMVADRGGIQKVCVPFTTDATCPACGGPDVEPCVNERPV